MAKRFSNTRKQEVHFRKALFRFCSLFIFILILGFLTRYYVNQIPMNEKIKKAFQLPEKYQLSLQNPEFVFAQGLIPIIGLRIQRIELYEKECLSKRMILQNTLFVLNPWRLLRSQIKMGWIKVGHLELDLPYHCQDLENKKHEKIGTSYAENKRSENEKNNQASGDTSKIQRTSSEGIEVQALALKGFDDKVLLKIFSEVDKIINFKKVSYLFVDSFTFRGLESFDHFTLIKGYLSATFKESLKADIHISEIKVNKIEVPLNSALLRLEVNLEKIIFNLKSLIREGQIAFKMTIENQKKYPTQIDFQMDKLPVSALSPLLTHGNLISYLWFNCIGTSRTHWSEVMKADLNLQSCGFDGPYGEIKLNQIQASFQGVKSVEAEIVDLNLDKILKSKRDVYLSGIFANYGQLSAQIIYNSNQFQAGGAFENSEFIFSNNNLRDIQKVSKIPFKFKGQANEWQAELKGIELEGGEIQGDVQVQVSQTNPNPQGKISFHKLILNPKVYKLMLNAVPSPFKLYGKFSFSNNRLADWSALLATPRLQSDTYLINNLKINAKSFAEKKSEINIKSNSGTIQKDSVLSEWIQPTTLDQQWNESEKNYKELSVRLLLSEKQTLEWKRAYLSFDNGWQLSSEGVRDEDKQVLAWVQWDKRDNSILRWSYQGLATKGLWSPNSSRIESWLEEHGDYLKKYKSVNYKVIKKESLREKLNDASQEALQKVKKVLGDKKNALPDVDQVKE